MDISFNAAVVSVILGDFKSKPDKFSKIYRCLGNFRKFANEILGNLLGGSYSIRDSKAIFSFSV